MRPDGTGRTGVRVEPGAKRVATLRRPPVRDHLVGELARAARFQLSSRLAQAARTKRCGGRPRPGAGLGERLAANAGSGWANGALTTRLSPPRQLEARPPYRGS